MNDRRDWDKAENRPPCTATTNPFSDLVGDDDVSWCAEEPTLNSALAEAYGEYQIEDEVPPDHFSHVGLLTHPGPAYVGKVYPLVCDECARLYYGIKGGFGCPHCGFDRRGGKKMYFTLWGAWGGKT